jgi:hypothetical protein
VPRLDLAGIHGKQGCSPISVCSGKAEGGQVIALEEDGAESRAVSRRQAPLVGQVGALHTAVGDEDVAQESVSPSTGWRHNALVLKAGRLLESTGFC